MRTLISSSASCLSTCAIMQRTLCQVIKADNYITVHATALLYFIELMSAIESSYADVPQATLIDKMYDVKSWLLPHLDPLHNHSYPHIFRFKRDASGTVVMKYKEWSKSPWEPSDAGIILFKVYNICPSGVDGAHAYRPYYTQSPDISNR